MGLIPNVGELEKLVTRLEAVAESMADSAYRTERAAQLMYDAASVSSSAGDKMQTSARMMQS